MIILQNFNWHFKSNPHKERIKEYNYALIILPIIIIWCIFLLLLKSEWEIKGFQNILYLTKVISITWLVMLPMKDYWNWAMQTQLLKSYYVIPFVLLMAISVIYLIGPLFALNVKWWSTYFLDNNRFFFGHTIITLSILFWSDILIKDHIVKEKETHIQEKVTIEQTISALNTNESNATLVTTHKLKLDYYVKKIDDCLLTTHRYEMTLRYADKAILFSLILTFCLYLVLDGVFNIHETEKDLYESYFEGAQIFSLIISTVIYFLIVKKYGHKTVYNN